MGLGTVGSCGAKGAQSYASRRAAGLHVITLGASDISERIFKEASHPPKASLLPMLYGSALQRAFWGGLHCC